MNRPAHHIFVCNSFRASGESQGVCHKKGGADFLPYIENEILDRGLSDVLVSSCGCLKACDHGPVLVIYPENLWYGPVESEEAIDEILDALEAGRAAETRLI